MNVFGRDLSGTPIVESVGGRNHFGDHGLMMMIGKNVNPGVTGGCTLLTSTVYGASGIDSTTGASVATGGDIAAADTAVSAAKTLGLALGIDASLLTPEFTDNGTVKPVTAVLNGVG